MYITDTVPGAGFETIY